MKKGLKNKIIVTSAMVGAVVATPVIVGAVEEQADLDLTGKVGLDQLENKALAFDAGMGTQTDPYIITSVSDFKTIGTYPAGTHFILGDNINLGSESLWTPIDITGVTLDGNGFTISNLTMSQVLGGGIFGKVTDSTIKNLNIDGVEIVGQQTTSTKMSNSGSLAVYALNSKFEKINAKNVRIHDKYGDSVGGLIGEGRNIQLYQIAVESDLQFDSGKSVGGVVGSITHARSLTNPAVWKEISSKSKIKNFGPNAISYRSGGVFGHISITGTELKDLPVLSDVVSNVDFEMAGGTFGGIYGYMNAASNSYYNKTAPLGTGEVIRIDRAVVYGNAKHNHNKDTSSQYYDIGYGDTLNVGVFPFVTHDRFSTMLNTDTETNYVKKLDTHIVKYQTGEMNKQNIYTPFGFDFENTWTMDMFTDSDGPRLAFHDIKNSDMQDFNNSEPLYSGGSGTVDDPYIIGNAHDLDNIRYNLDANYLIESSIWLEGKTFLPIGSSQVPFTGSIKANNVTIYDFKLPLSKKNIGLFGYTSGASFEGITVADVKMENPLPSRDKWQEFINTSSLNSVYTGGLIGAAHNTDLKNIGAAGDFELYGYAVGAIVGNMSYTSSVEVENVSVNLSDSSIIVAKHDAGGFAGKIMNSTPAKDGVINAKISNVSIDAQLLSLADAGGFAGHIDANNLIVKDVVLAGTLDTMTRYAVGNGYVGGFVGDASTGNSTFRNIVMYNRILAGTRVGGFGGVIGSNYTNKYDAIFAANGYMSPSKTTVIDGNSFSHFATNANSYTEENFNKVTSNVFGWTGTNVDFSGVNKTKVNGMFTTKQMKDTSFFQKNSSMDFDSTWKMTEQGPILKNAGFNIFHQTWVDNYDLLGTVASNQFAGGIGTQTEPYLIETAEQLGLITSMPSKHFKLISDIWLDSNFNILSPTTATKLTGSFDGGGHTIGGLSITTTGTYQGLFGYVGSTGKIKNLELFAPWVESNYTYTGILVGKLEGIVENVKISSPHAEIGKSYFGTIAALVSGSDAVIKDVAVLGLVLNAPTTVDYVGGVAGNITGAATVNGVVSDVNISAGEKLGGFAGQIGSTGSYKNIQIISDIRGLSYLGGYVGNMTAASTHTDIVVNASEVGGSEAVDYIGGFAGDISSKTTTVKNIIVNVKKVNGSKTASVGKFSGGYPTALVSANIAAKSSMTTNGHSTNVQFNLSDAQLKDKATYEKYGFTFGGESKWMFYKKEGVATLKNGASYPRSSGVVMTGQEIGAYSDEFNESIARDNIDYAVKNKSLQFLTFADGYVEKLSDKSSEKTTLSSQVESERAYLEAIQDLKELQVNKDAKTFERIQENMGLIADGTKRNEIQLALSNIQTAYNAQQTLMTTARTAVEKAETTKAYNDIMYAEQALTFVSTNSVEKVQLWDRLTPLYEDAVESNKLVAFINKIDAGFISNDLETVRTNLESYESSEKGYDRFLNPDKHKAQIRKYYEQFGYAVTSGEIYKVADDAIGAVEKDLTKEALDKAKKEIDKLPDGEKKTQLLDKIQELEDRITNRAKIDQLIGHALENGDENSLDQAKAIFDSLTNPRDIQDYAPVIANATLIIQITILITIAENDKTPEAYDKAKSELDKLDSKNPYKDELLKRLEALEKEIAALKAIQAAELAVIKAEGSLETVDITAAQKLIDKIPTTPESAVAKKTELNERLDAVRAAVVAKESFGKAKDAVDKAEKSKAEADVATAQKLIDTLPNGDEKQALQDRIDTLKAEIAAQEAIKKAVEEATKAVEKAEGSKSDADIENAQLKVTALPEGADKTALQNRLDKVKADLAEAEAGKLALAEATKAVENAEGSKTDADINDAQTKVTALKNSPEKQVLQDRIDAVKADIANQLAKEKALAEATKAVEKAEDTKNAVDVSDAQAKLTALPEGADKTALQDRLDKVKTELAEGEAGEKALTEAIAAVEKAEGSKTDVDVKDAQTKVTALPEGTDKTTLQDRLDKLKAEIAEAELNEKLLAEATKAVEKAEGSKTDVDLNDAQTKVTALKDSSDKDALQKRLDKLKAELTEGEAGEKALVEATKAVEKAEGSKSKSDIEDAQTKVTALKVSSDKTALQKRLDKLKAELAEVEAGVKALDEATKAVEKAEGSKAKSDIKDAQTKVTALKDSSDKDALQKRLDKLKADAEDTSLFEKLIGEVKDINQNILDGKVRVDKFNKKKVELEEIRKEGEAIKNATDKEQLNVLIDATLVLMNLVEKIEAGDKSIETIEKLPESKIKNDYLSELSKENALIAAEKAVVQAEKTIVLENIEAADKIVSKLAPSDKKKELNKRLDAVKALYTQIQAIAEATKAVEQAESTLRSSDIERAEKAVKKLADGPEKEVLKARMDALYKKVDSSAYDAAVQAVEKAETLRTNNSIAYAKEKVASLRDSKEKTALEERIKVLEKSIYTQAEMDRLYKQALEAVEKAERSTIITYLSTAIKLTNKVSDADTRKSGLEDRIKAIQLRNLIAATGEELDRLERKPTQKMVEKVQEMLEQIPETADEKEGFIARLEAVKKGLDNENYAKALKGVEFAEAAKIESKRAAYYTALPLVDVLLDGERKTLLEERLIAVLREVENYERMDGDYNSGDDIVKAAESIKDAKVKKYLLDWAKAVVNAENYYGGTLSKALTKAKISVPAEVLKNEKYADLIKELKERTLHIEQSEKVFGKPAQTHVKKAYVAVLAFEKNRTKFNRNDAMRWVDDLRKFGNSSLQVEKFMERINRINVIEEKK